MKNRIRNMFDDRKRDRQLHTSILRHLDHAGHGRMRRVRCEVQDGTVVLWGFVANEADLDLALDIVQRCPHVDSVLNHIQLKPMADTGQPSA